MNHKMKKTIWLVLISALLLLYLAGCSTVKNMIGWVNPWTSDKTKAGLTDKDVTQFVSNVRSNGGNPDSHYLLACYYQGRGNHREALKEFDKVLIIDPNYVKAYNGVGVSYDLLGDFSRAMESYKSALKLNPDLDYVQNNLGYSYLLQGNPDEAITAFKRAIALNDRDRRFHNNLGLAYAEKGQFDLALTEFKRAGDEARAYYHMAQICFKKGLYDEAKSLYAIALNLNPSMTVSQSEANAAHILARIFPSVSGRSETGEFVIPDKPVIEKPEVEKGMTEGPSTILAANAKKDESIDRLADETRVVKESVVPNQTIIVNIEETRAEEEIVSQLGMTGIKKEQYLTRNEQKNVKQSKGPTGVGIEISNGNGVNGMARRVGDYLKERGFMVIRLTNAEHFNHPATRIYYQKGFGDEALQVAQQIVLMVRDMEELKKLDRVNVKVKILIGRDLISQNKVFGEKRS